MRENEVFKTREMFSQSHFTAKMTNTSTLWSDSLENNALMLKKDATIQYVDHSCVNIRAHLRIDIPGFYDPPSFRFDKWENRIFIIGNLTNYVMSHSPR